MPNKAFTILINSNVTLLLLTVMLYHTSIIHNFYFVRVVRRLRYMSPVYSFNIDSFRYLENAFRLTASLSVELRLL